MRLNGLRALVTGAAGGIGKAVVAKLQAGGARVAAADLELGYAVYWYTVGARRCTRPETRTTG